MASSSSTTSSTTTTATAHVLSDHHHTYESTRARESLSSQADRIHWHEPYSFRSQPYRHLHHQRGVIGNISIRLCEGQNLQRSHWSPLALGPVKHLGLSKAHGPVSAFCQFYLQYTTQQQQQQEENQENETIHANNIDDRKPPPSKAAASFSSDHHRPPSHVTDLVTSPVIPHNDHPTWENCTLSLPVRKGHAPDGSRMQLVVRVHEDATAVETVLPGSPARLLGMGTVDITSICLGQTPTNLLDLWIPLQQPTSTASTKTNNNPDEDTDNGRIHVLVSYQPHGLEPQKDDVVALEAFARRTLSQASCRPILAPPLQPLRVVDRRGSYLLVRTLRRECLRLHRHAVFVVERTNLVDAAHNLVCLPADFVQQTPLGRHVTTAARPVLHASQELLMPALLSLRLLWMAVRTTTLASLKGVQALGQTLVEEGVHALVPDEQHATTGTTTTTAPHDASNEQQAANSIGRPRGSGNVKFVQL